MKGREKIAMLSLYTQPMARLCDPLVEIILVGDSLGMVIYGYDSTLAVTLDMMIKHGQAVVKGCDRALTVIDMPFGTVEVNESNAIKNCESVLEQTGAMSVKIEGGKEMAQTIATLHKKNIAVMGHVGLLPQRAKQMGGFKTQGMNKNDWQNIIDDAVAIESAGAYAIVIEAVAEELAQLITEAVTIPTIGIGASKHCDGQVLVLDDLLGMVDDSRKKPRFVRRFANLNQNIVKAVMEYKNAVKDQTFPNDDETYHIKES